MRFSLRFVIAICVLVSVDSPALADFSDLTAAQQHALATQLGLPEQVTVNGKTTTLVTLAQRASVKEAIRERALVQPRPPTAGAAPAPAPLETPIVGTTPDPRTVVIPRTAPSPLPSVPEIALPTAAPTSSPPDTQTALGNVANFFSHLAVVCIRQWVTQSTCNADLTTSTPSPWLEGPPGKFTAPNVGTGDPKATPPPLPSVVSAGSEHPSQLALDADIAGARSLHPPIAAGAAGTPGLLAALHDAEMTPAYASATNVPPAAIHSVGVVGSVDGDFARMSFDGNVTSPDFFVDDTKDAAFGLTATSSTTFDMHLDILHTSFATSTKLASLTAQTAIPTGGAAPYLDVDADILGVSGNKHETYSAVGPSLSFSEARKQSQTNDICNLSQTIQPIPSVNISFSLSCPVTVGYVLAINAVPAEASMTLSPVAAVGLEGRADVSAAGGLIAIDVVASADLLTLDGRVGAYVDLVRNPMPSQPAFANDLYVTTRPYGFATVRSLDGVLYLSVRCAGKTANLKLYAWKPGLAQDVPDTSSFSAYRIVGVK